MFNNTTRLSQPQNSFFTPCSSHNYNRDNIDSFPYLVFFSTSIIIALLSPVAVAGNALVLVAVWRKTLMRTPFHILLSGLAFTDLCIGLVAQPFYAATFLMCSINSTVVHDSPMFVTTTRTIGEGSGIFFIAATILILTVMSIERWLYMSRRSLITWRRACFTVIALMLIPIPATVLRVLENADRVYRLKLRLLLSTEMVSCYLIISIANFKVYRVIRRHQLQIQANTTLHNFGQSAIDLAKYKKSVATMIYILLVFSLCFLPYVFSTVIYFGLGRKTLETYSTVRVSVMFLFLSSSLNPALYFWRMNDIRNEVRQLFCRGT